MCLDLFDPPSCHCSKYLNILFVPPCFKCRNKRLTSNWSELFVGSHGTSFSCPVSRWWDWCEAPSLVWKTLEHEPSLSLTMMKEGWHAAKPSGSGTSDALTQIEWIVEMVLRMKSLWRESCMGSDIASFLPCCCCIMNMHMVASESVCADVCGYVWA